MSLNALPFWVFAGIALLSAVAMLTRKSPLDGAICLIVCLLSFAGLYAMLDAPFVAVMQVLVYAGAIMMLIVFVIMTIDIRERPSRATKPVLIGALFGTSLMVLCMALFYTALKNGSTGTRTTVMPSGTVERIGMLLFTNHVLNFEMISLLLLTALIGALVLGKKHVPVEGTKS